MYGEKGKSTPLTMRQAWEIDNKGLEELEKEKNDEVERNKKNKHIMVTPARQETAPDTPLPSEGGTDANPQTERIEGNPGREDPVTEALIWKRNPETLC